MPIPVLCRLGLYEHIFYVVNVVTQDKRFEFVRLAVVMCPLYIVYHAVIIIYLFVYGANRLDPEFHTVLLLDPDFNV